MSGCAEDDEGSGCFSDDATNSPDSPGTAEFALYQWVILSIKRAQYSLMPFRLLLDHVQWQ